MIKYYFILRAYFSKLVAMSGRVLLAAKFAPKENDSFHITRVFSQIGSHERLNTAAIFTPQKNDEEYNFRKLVAVDCLVQPIQRSYIIFCYHFGFHKLTGKV